MNIHLLRRSGEAIYGYFTKEAADAAHILLLKAGVEDCDIKAVEMADEPSSGIPVLGNAAHIEQRLPAGRRSRAELDEQVRAYVGLHEGATLDDIAEGAGMERGTAERAAQRLKDAGTLAFMDGRYRLARAEAAE